MYPVTYNDKSSNNFREIFKRLRNIESRLGIKFVNDRVNTTTPAHNKVREKLNSIKDMRCDKSIYDNTEFNTRNIKMCDGSRSIMSPSPCNHDNKFGEVFRRLQHIESIVGISSVNIQHVYNNNNNVKPFNAPRPSNYSKTSYCSNAAAGMYGNQSNNTSYESKYNQHRQSQQHQQQIQYQRQMQGNQIHDNNNAHYVIPEFHNADLFGASNMQSVDNMNSRMYINNNNDNNINNSNNLCENHTSNSMFNLNMSDTPIVMSVPETVENPLHLSTTPVVRSYSLRGGDSPPYTVSTNSISESYKHNGFKIKVCNDEAVSVGQSVPTGVGLDTVVSVQKASIPSVNTASTTSTVNTDDTQTTTTTSAAATAAVAAAVDTDVLTTNTAVVTTTDQVIPVRKSRARKTAKPSIKT